MAIFLGGSLGTLADSDTRKAEVIWGQKAPWRALLGTFSTLSLSSEVTWGQKAKETLPQVLRRGRSVPKGPLTRNFQGVFQGVKRVAGFFNFERCQGCALAHLGPEEPLQVCAGDTVWAEGREEFSSFDKNPPPHRSSPGQKTKLTRADKVRWDLSGLPVLERPSQGLRSPTYWKGSRGTTLTTFAGARKVEGPCFLGEPPA